MFAAASPRTNSGTSASSSLRRSDNFSARWTKDVAHAPDRLDQGWVDVVHLAPQVADVGLQDVGVTAKVVVPDVVQDLGLAQHPIGVAEQVAQEWELGSRQLHQFPGAPDLIRVLVHLEVGDDESLGGRLIRGAVSAKHHPDARHQLLPAEGFGYVVFAADGESP